MGCHIIEHMKQENYCLQMTMPKAFRTTVGMWIRAARQQRHWTQAMLASRAGVPVSTLSRLEQTGLGSIELLSKLLFALGAIDSLNDIVQERIRLATLPADLSELTNKTLTLPKRIRVKKEKT